MSKQGQITIRGPFYLTSEQHHLIGLATELVEIGQALLEWAAETNAARDSCWDSLDRVMEKARGCGDALPSPRLVGAAPDLLEACKALAEYVSPQWLNDWDNRPNHLRMAEDAIAIAEKEGYSIADYVTGLRDKLQAEKEGT